MLLLRCCKLTCACSCPCLCRNIIPYIKKHKKHPITGKELSVKDLIKLTFHKNTEGEFICPITYKAFTGLPLFLHLPSCFLYTPHTIILMHFFLNCVDADYSHIVFIRTSGQVYSMEAIDQLNIKTKNWTVSIIL